MKPDKNVVPVYHNLSYYVHTIENDNMDGDPFNYVVDFSFQDIENKIIRIEIEEDDLFVLHKLSQTEEIPQHQNIATIFYILRGIDANIKAAFLTKNEDEELNIRFTILISNKSVLIINLNIVAGISLSQLFRVPITITEDLFNECCEEEIEDEDYDG